MVARMSGEPGLHLGMRVRAVVVQDQMDVPPARRGPLDPLQERQELAVPQSRQAGADHRSVQHVERGKQRGAMADIVMGLPGRNPGPQRQHRLGSAQCLDLALLIHTQHQSLGGRVILVTHGCGCCFCSLISFERSTPVAY